MEIAKRVGKNLKDARIYKNMTQKELASLLLMTQQQYSRFETGKYELNYQQIIRLCEILDISPNDLFA